MANLDSTLKSRDITLLTKVHMVKAMVFPGVMNRCESWTIKKADHQIIDAFQLWCCRRLLRVWWSARRSNQSILKEINPECSLEGLMMKLKFQYFGYLMQRANSLEKTLMMGKIIRAGGREEEVKGRGGRAGGKGSIRGWDGWMASPTQWTWVWANSRRYWRTGKPGCSPWGSQSDT